MNYQNSITREIAQCFAQRGCSEYGGESVTQLEHALQCAMLAELAQAPASLVVAALLHDIGHLFHDLPEDAPDRGIDDHHENSGYRYLEKNFDLMVTEPVRQHVAAKRYLCTIDASYAEQLSEPSRVSLALQGGNMTHAELDSFRSHRYWRESVQLRKWDDEAKVVGLKTPGLEKYLLLIDRLALPNSQ